MEKGLENLYDESTQANEKIQHWGKIVRAEIKQLENDLEGL
jgi:hypothetical protein